VRAPVSTWGTFQKNGASSLGTDSFMKREKLRSKSKKQLAAAKCEIQQASRNLLALPSEYVVIGCGVDKGLRTRTRRRWTKRTSTVILVIG
jgi:hypothetical protein